MTNNVGCSYRGQKDDLIQVPGFIGSSADSGDTYRYDQYLSSGSCGSTWRIVRNADSVMFALKITRLDNLSHEGRMRTDIEVQCLEAVSHFACIHLQDKHRTDKFLFLVLEYCDAGDLRFQLSHLRTHRISVNPMTDSSADAARPQVGMEEYRVRFILLQLVLGLQYMHVHRKILHRDLKPANVLLTTNGLVKIGDFGLSNAYDTISGDVGRTICGTPAYLAPELWAGRHYGLPADMWSLGVLLYECMTSCTPFAGNSIESLKRNTVAGEAPMITGNAYPDALKAIVTSLLQKDPEARPSSTALLNTSYLKEALAEFPRVLAVSNIPAPLLRQVESDINKQLECIPQYVVDTSVSFYGEVEKLKPPELHVLRHLTLADGKLTIERSKTKSNSYTKHSRHAARANGEAGAALLETTGSVPDSRASTPLSLDQQRANAANMSNGNAARNGSALLCNTPPLSSIPSKNPNRSCIPLSSIESVECLDAENFALRVGDHSFLFFRTPDAVQWTEHLRRGLGWPQGGRGRKTALDSAYSNGHHSSSSGNRTAL